jgi:hypothetical protein
MTSEIVTYSREHDLKKARQRQYAREYYHRNKKARREYSRNYYHRKKQPSQPESIRLSLWSRIKVATKLAYLVLTGPHQ